MNILPILGSRWILNNCTQSGLSFTFTGAGSARVYFMESDIKAFAPGTLTALVFPEGLSQLVDIKCNIHIRTGAAFNTHSCFLVSNEESIYEALINLKTGSYDEAFFEIATNGACSVQQVSLDIITQSFDEVIEELRSELPKLLDDYNTYTIELTNEEVTVGLITANLLENTDLQGHFTLSFLASNKAEIVLRVYDDQRKCLYSPSVVSVNAGKHTIGFPHSYLRSKIGYHNFYVTLQATMGTVKVPTRAMLYTIDGAHMAERLLDSFYAINDITAKTSAASVEPTLLYTVGIVDNLATIRHIEPNQIGISNWAVDFVVPNVKEAAIEFDGSWYAGATRRMFVTNETPTLFYTDTSNVLWTQLFDSTARVQLAMDVVKVCAVRGWRYIDALVANDTGLITAYIKTDGKAYYRQYINIPGGAAYWSSEEQLPFVDAIEPLSTIASGRLNDYRISFTVQDAEGNDFTLITRRYYQADTVESTTIETTDANSSLKMASYIDPKPITAWNTSNTETFVQFDYPMDDYVGKQAAFKLKDGANVEDAAISTERFDDYTIKIVHNNIGGFTPGLSVVFTNSYIDHRTGPLVCTHEGLPFAVQAFTLPFEAIDFSLKGYGFDTVNIANANATITVIPIGFINGYGAETVGIAGAGTTIFATLVTYKCGYNGAENIQIANANASVVITKVGTDPL